LRAARRRGRGITFILDGEGQIRLGYAEVLMQARRCLGYLGRAGLTRGDKAILVFRENRDFVITFWACVLGGIVPVPVVYPASLAQDSHALSKLRAVWEQLGRPKLLTDHRFMERLPEIERLLEVSDLPALTATESEWSETRPARAALAGPDDLAFIQFSSGSTGEPKGVMLTHRNLLSNIEAIILRMGVRKEERFLSWMPYHHDMGLIGFHLTPLAIRCDQVNLSPFKFVLEPPLWFELVHRHRVTVTGSPNFGYRLLLDKLQDEQLGRWDLRCLRP